MRLIIGYKGLSLYWYTSGRFHGDIPDWCEYNNNRDRNQPLRWWSGSGGMASLGRSRLDAAAYWDGKTDTGEYVSSGVFFYTIQAGEFKATGKMAVEK